MRVSRKTTGALVAAAVTGFLALAGCGGTSGDNTDNAGGDPVLSSIYAIENHAEDAFNSAMNRNDAAVRQKVDAVNKKWWGTRPALIKRGVPADDLHEMDRAVRRLTVASSDPPSRTFLAGTANAVIGESSGLMAALDVRVPSDIIDFGFTAREVAIWAARHNLRQAGEQLRALEWAWKSGLRDKVVDAGGDWEASAMDRMLARLDNALREGSAAGVVREARGSLDLIDAIRNIGPRDYAAIDETR